MIPVVVRKQLHHLAGELAGICLEIHSLPAETKAALADAIEALEAPGVNNLVQLIGAIETVLKQDEALR